MLTRFDSMTAGARAVAPILLGVAPFAMIYGAVAVAAGVTKAGTMGMSLAVFAGAAQLAAVGLLAKGAPAAVAIFTALVINLRMVMYSASLAPHFSGLSPLEKAPLAYLLTDQAYALSIARFCADGPPVNKPWFYFGAGIALWAVWQCCVAAGAFLGAAIPASWELDFAIPLTFMALVVPAIRDRACGAAALAAGLAALAGRVLPYNLGLVLAAVCGIGAGYLFEQRSGRHVR